MPQDSILKKPPVVHGRNPKCTAKKSNCGCAEDEPYCLDAVRNMLEDGYFDIGKVDIGKLTFLKDNSFLLECFKLAKKLKKYER